MSEMTLPPNLTKIGGSAFYECISLSEITVPPSLTEIGAFAFEGCTSLSEIMLPFNLAEIGHYASMAAQGRHGPTIDIAARPAMDVLC